jgi:hypothetical protein
LGLGGGALERSGSVTEGRRTQSAQQPSQAPPSVAHTTATSIPILSNGKPTERIKPLNFAELQSPCHSTAQPKGTPIIPFATLTDTRGQKIAVIAEIVQFVKAADNAPGECLVVFGKNQMSPCAGRWRR